LKPRLLDLFCGAGGASAGYARAGFDVMGVDIVSQPHYPFRFWKLDALMLAPWVLSAFDAVHASPPCQHYSLARRIRDREHVDLIAPTRELLERSGVLYVIENVKHAPLHDPVVLEGQMFDELRTHRPRYFETNWPLVVPFMRPPPPRSAQMGRRANGDEWPNLVGHFPDVKDARRAMGISWMTRDELREAIPPAYSELIGLQLLDLLSNESEVADGD